MHSSFVALRMESAVAGCGVDVHGRMEIMYRHEEEREEQEKEKSNLWVITAERGMPSMGNGNRQWNKKVEGRNKPKI
jgi:hypothetical protein